MFYNLAELIRRTERRLRQVVGQSAQLYSEPVLKDMLEETYQMVRSQRFWDHLTSFQQRTLDGSTGTITVGIAGAIEGFRDVHSVSYGRSNMPLPIVGTDTNTLAINGSTARYIQPLHFSADTTGDKLFRVLPINATGDVLVRVRTDGGALLFSDANNLIPFDWTVLVNGAGAKYLADDGNNPAAQAVLDRTFNERLQQLQSQHDAVIIELDPRANRWQNGWSEEL